MLNRVIISGSFNEDPEYRTTPSGVSVATFTLAVNRYVHECSRGAQADFINCVVFRDKQIM